jgi:non-specific serine/threonine protein kinase
MRTLVYLLPEALADPPSMAEVAVLAANDELVLVCVQYEPGRGFIPALRAAVGRQPVVALLIDGEVRIHERRLIGELLDEGKVPLILTVDDPVAARLANWMWLDADDILVLPADVTTTHVPTLPPRRGDLDDLHIIASGAPKPFNDTVASVSRRLPTGNLPAELSSFVDRRRELADVARLLAAARLVTLTGAGGVGKSRLALRVAGAARRAFGDGVWLVELAGLRDPMLLPLAVSTALGISDQTARDQTDVLTGFLADRRALLVVDNCEHLMPACAFMLGELLAAAPGLRVLATSREVMHLPGEHVYPVTPLAVPDADQPVTAAGMGYPAVELFADRAAAASPGFAVTGDNAELVAEVCRRLDGIPLAIELATSRLYALSLAQIASLLEDRFGLVTRGSRAALPRHQTLRAAVEWSFELCAKPERLLWLRASVFTGRFDLAGAEQVCGGDGLRAADVVEALTGLVDKSVLIADAAPDGPRYRLLDTIRQYGLDRLQHPDDADIACGMTTVSEPQLRRRHRDYYLGMAERFHADWFGPRQPEWTARMRADLPNLRSALGYCLDRPDEAQAGMRLAGMLYYFWYGCGEIREGRLWLERVLATDARPGRERMRALAAYGRLLILQGAPAEAADTARACLALATQFDEPFYVSHALQTLGLGVMYLGDLPAAGPLLEQAVARARALGTDHPATAFTTFAWAVGVLLIDDDPVRAGELLAESRAICRAHGDQWWLGNVLSGSIHPALRLGDVAQATAYGREALQVRRTLHDPQGAASAVELLAWTAAADHDYVRAARLLGATDRHWRDVGGSPFGAGQWLRDHDSCETATRHGLGEARFDTEFRRGADLSLDEAVAYCLGGPHAPAHHAPTPTSEGPQLTKREAEIAALVARGLTNKQIADRLVISQRTAESHVENILTKFGFTTRAQIAVWYTEQHRPP